MQRPLTRKRSLLSWLLVSGLCLAGLEGARAQDRFGQMSLDELHRWIGVAVERFANIDIPGAARVGYRGDGCSIEVTWKRSFGEERDFTDARSIRSVEADRLATMLTVVADWKHKGMDGFESRMQEVTLLIGDERYEMAAAFEELRRRCRSMDSAMKGPAS
jgi:hypothetical protein